MALPIPFKKLIRLAGEHRTPLYAYDLSGIRARCRELRRDLADFAIYYACKANTNAEVMRLIAREGLGIETVSPGEVRAAKKAGVPAERITFTCSSIEEKELVSVVKQGVRVHLDSLHQVEIFGRHFPGRGISVRLNQGVGAGHHAHVVTGGPNSKFGVYLSDIGKLKKLAAKYDLKITGLHQHIGSNVLDAGILKKAMDLLFRTAELFPDLTHLDFGGGLGVPYQPGDKHLDTAVFGRKARESAARFSKQYGRELKMSFEPGRYPVAEAGYLLVTVTDIKENPEKTFVGVNSGFNHLIRPAMYGSYHEILNLSRPKARPRKVTVAGNICESGDVFAVDRLLAAPRIGDILAIRNAGAYGFTMSSDYNLRAKPGEICF